MGKPQVVADVMTRDPIVLREEDDLWSAQEDMDNLGYHHAPVVDGERLVGLVSHQDLLRAAASSLRRDSLHTRIDETDRHGTFVASIMERDVATVRPSTPLAEAARKLKASGSACLPVTDEDGTLRGILTGLDFVDLALTLLEG